MSRLIRNYSILLISTLIVGALTVWCSFDIAHLRSHQFRSQCKLRILTKTIKAFNNGRPTNKITVLNRPGIHIRAANQHDTSITSITNHINNKTQQWILFNPESNRFVINTTHANRPSLFIEFEPNLFARDEILHDIGVIALLLILYIIISAWVTIDLNKPIKELKTLSHRLHDVRALPQILNNSSNELEPIIAAINQQNQRINKLNADRSNMLAAISHDLRTPITRLRLRSESISDEALQNKINIDCDDMEQMINGALSFIQSESNEHATQFDLISLIESLCIERQDIKQLCAFNSEIHYCEFHGQLHALKRALANLIDNGIKYGNQVTLNIHQYADKIQIDIIDQGPGIPVHEMQQVFEPFYRIERSRNRNTGGTGLGLVIAKNIIEQHNGSIHLTNINPHGLQARVTLPT